MAGRNNKKMKKIAVWGVLMVLLTGIMAGCSQKTVSFDIRALSTALSEDGGFKDQLAEVNADVAKNLYGLSDEQVKDCVLVMSSGATAEEIAVFEAADSAAAAEIKKACDTRVEDQKEACKDYLPNEMEKLNAPVIVTAGNYVILCISNDNEKAKEIISEYTKN